MFFKVFNAVFFLAFVASGVVQYNDPDPAMWIIFYSFAAFFCVLAAINVNTFWSGIAMLAYCGGVAYYMPGWSVDSAKLLLEPKMSTYDVELAREAFGLMICAFWMLCLTIRWVQLRKTIDDEDSVDAILGPDINP